MKNHRSILLSIIIFLLAVLANQNLLAESSPQHFTKFKDERLTEYLNDQRLYNLGFQPSAKKFETNEDSVFPFSAGFNRQQTRVLSISSVNTIKNASPLTYHKEMAHYFTSKLSISSAFIEAWEKQLLNDIQKITDDLKLNVNNIVFNEDHSIAIISGSNFRTVHLPLDQPRLALTIDQQGSIKTYIRVPYSSSVRVPASKRELGNILKRLYSLYHNERRIVGIRGIGSISQQYYLAMLEAPTFSNPTSTELNTHTTTLFRTSAKDVSYTFPQLRKLVEQKTPLAELSFINDSDEKSYFVTLLQNNIAMINKNGTLKPDKDIYQQHERTTNKVVLTSVIEEIDKESVSTLTSREKKISKIVNEREKTNSKTSSKDSTRNTQTHTGEVSVETSVKKDFGFVKASVKVTGKYTNEQSKESLKETAKEDSKENETSTTTQNDTKTGSQNTKANDITNRSQRTISYERTIETSVNQRTLVANYLSRGAIVLVPSKHLEGQINYLLNNINKSLSLKVTDSNIPILQKEDFLPVQYIDVVNDEIVKVIITDNDVNSLKEPLI